MRLAARFPVSWVYVPCRSVRPVRRGGQSACQPHRGRVVSEAAGKLAPISLPRLRPRPARPAEARPRNAGHVVRLVSIPPNRRARSKVSGQLAARLAGPVSRTPPPHSVAECQFSTNLIITFDRNKIQTSKWYHFVSLVKAIRMTYNKALTHQVMTLIRGIFKFTTSLYVLK